MRQQILIPKFIITLKLNFATQYYQHNQEIKNILVYKLIHWDQIKNKIFAQLNQFNQIKDSRDSLKIFNQTYLIQVETVTDYIRLTMIMEYS